MEIKFRFRRKTDGIQRKEGTALQTFRLETLDMLFGERCVLPVRSVMAASNIRGCQRVQLLELANEALCTLNSLRQE
jgi:hypothetical protein